MVAIFTGLGSGFERGSAAALGGGGLLGSSAFGRGGEGVFLNATTGNLVLTRQDEFLVGRGPDVAIARTYNSLGALDDNGDHWRQSTDRRVYGLTGTANTTGSTVKRVSADGSEVTYTYNGSFYTTTDGAGAHEKLAYDGANWTWTDGSTQLKEVYGLWTDTNNVTFGLVSGGVSYIARQYDTDGNTITFKYENAKLSRIATSNDTTGQQSAIEYGWSGANLTSVLTKYTDYSGASPVERTLIRTTYGYDGSNRLITVTIDETPQDIADNATDPETLYAISYTYDGASNRVASITQSDGASLAISYVFDSGTSTFRVSQLAQTVASGDTRTTSISYVDEGNGLTRTEVTDPLGKITKLWSKTLDDTNTANTDERGQLVRVVFPPERTGETPLEVNYAYDGAGNVLSVISKRGTVTLATVAYQYDAQGNLTQITDANGEVTTRTYTSNNAVQRETRTGSSSGSASTSLYTRYVYDGENHLRFLISPGGRVTEYRYEASGELKSTIQYTQDFYTPGPTTLLLSEMETWSANRGAKSEVTQYIYDARGNLLETRAFGAADQTGVGLEGGDGYRFTHFSYDQSGQLLSRYSNVQATETFAYDGMGRLILSTDLAAGTTQIIFNDAAMTTTVKTRMVKPVDAWLESAETHITVSTYNKAGELVSVTDSASTIGDGSFTNGGTATFLYDKNGRLRMSTDATLRKSWFVYDDTGKKVADIAHNGEVVEYRYDQLGRLVTTARYINKLTSTQLDTLSNPLSDVVLGDATLPRPAAHIWDIWQWSIYDAGGRVIETIEGDGSVTTYAYDQAGRLVRTTGYYAKLTSTQISGFMTTPPSSTVLPAADPVRDRIVRTFYDRDGNLIGALNPEGALSRFIYDAAGRKVQEIAYANLTDPAQRASGTFDALLASFAADPAHDVSTRYVYDGQGLLRYTIDALSRVTEYVYAAPDLRTNGKARMTIVYATPLGVPANYAYATIKSAVASLSNALDRVSYAVYNERDQLVYSIDALGAVIGFAYDASGRLIKTTQFADIYNVAGLGTDWKASVDDWADDHLAGARITRTYYSERGEILYVVDAEGYVTRRDYDQEGRLSFDYRYELNNLGVTDQTTLSQIHNANKGASVLTTYQYDKLGRLVDVYDGIGVRRTKSYRANGLLALEIVSYAQGADEQRIEYIYDQAGKLVITREHTSEASNATAMGATQTVLMSGQKLVSANTQYRAVLSRDGALRVYHKGELIWTSGSQEEWSGADYRLAAESNGRLVIYRQVTGQADVQIWSSPATGYSGATYFEMKDNGNFVLHGGTSPTQNEIWSTQTTNQVATNPDAAYELDTVYTYDGLGNVLTIKDKRNNITSFEYDRAGRVTKSINPASLGGFTSFQYDAFGRGVKTIDALGGETFSYFDRLSRVILHIAAHVEGQGYAVATAYNAFGEAASVTRHATPITAPAVGAPPTPATAAADEVTSFTYDKIGRTLTRTNAEGGVAAYQYDAFGRLVKSTDERGNPSYFYYDDLGRVELAIDAEGHATETKYTPWGYVEHVTRHAETASGYSVTTRPSLVYAQGVDARTSFTYDAAGRLLSQTDAEGGVTTYAYDRRGNVVKITNALGGVTERSYDKADRVISETVWFGTYNDPNAQKATTTFQYDKNGNLTKKVEAGMRTTLYAYDALDRLTQITHDAFQAATSATSGTSSTAPTETFVYDLNGNVIERVAAGSRTLYWRDKLGRVTHELSPAGTLKRHFYDAAGNVIETRVFASVVAHPQNPGGDPPTEPSAYRATMYDYDRLNRVIEVRAPSAKHATFATGTLAVADAVAITSYLYDAMGNVVRTTDANGGQTFAYYDKLGRKLTQIDAANYRTDWIYDSDGNVEKETRYANVAVWGAEGPNITTPASVTPNPGQDRVTSFTYDLMGRRLTETREKVLIHNTASPGAHIEAAFVTISYTYNALGQVETKTESTGDRIRYGYDKAGRLTLEQRLRADSANPANDLYAYLDFAGAQVTPTLEYAYDGLGNLTQTRQFGNANAAERVTTYAYDATTGWRLKSVTDAEGFKRSYVYDVAGRVVREEYNRLDFTAGAVANEGVGYDYDAEGRVTKQGFLRKISGAWTRSSLDAANNETIDTTHTLYNVFGEVIGRGLNLAPANVGNAAYYSEKFEYDNAGRLARTNAGDGVWKLFLYDKAGNQTLMIQSAGADFSAAALDTVDEVLALWSSHAAIATTNVAGVVATITKYDARNQAVLVLEPQRQLTSSASADLRTSRAYNAFGDVIRETNANGHDAGGNPIASASIEYAYNTMGRLIQTTSPAVEARGDNGNWITGYTAAGAPNASSTTATTFRPIEHRYYDLSGRLVASRDANGNLTKLSLLAGTGYGGSEALVRVVTTADNASVTTDFDIHGNARKITDQLSRVTTQSFDKLGRLTQVDRPGAPANHLIEYYAYDGVGQRRQRWNNLLGVANAESTTYDQQGRILQHVAMGGDTTTYAYGWSSAIATSGMGTFGGWTQTTTYANQKQLIDKSDMFGRAVQHTDMSSLVSDLSYDKAGRLIQRTGGDALNHTYFNTGRLATLFATTGAVTRTGAFGYDKVGNLISETLVSGAQQLKNMTASYDALGRMTSWDELGSANMPAASVDYAYDANGNIRRASASYHLLDAQGAASASAITRDQWYRFDKLNRVVLQAGTLSAGQISGRIIAYNDAGERVTEISGFWASEIVEEPWFNPQTGMWEISEHEVEFMNERREDFSYDANGRLSQVRIAYGAYDPITGGNTPPSGPGAVRADYTYDLMGRIILQRDYQYGTVVAYSREVVYNSKSQIVSEETNTKRGSDIFTTETAFAYGAGTSYALGAALTVTTVNYLNNNEQDTSLTTNSYAWADGAIQTQITHNPDIDQSDTDPSIYSYITVGGQKQLTTVQIFDNRTRTVTWRNDLHGQAIKRDEQDNLSNGDPHEIWYRFGGKQMGAIGNNGEFGVSIAPGPAGTERLDKSYDASIQARTAEEDTGPFRYGRWTPIVRANFDQSLAPINSFTSGASGGGAYVVRDGDTLASIAASLWGDASLWWKLAEANGLSAGMTLVEGQSLITPAGVAKSTHNANTFKPYDSLEALGNTSPTAPNPRPDKMGKCATFGMVLMAVVAVVVATKLGPHVLRFFGNLLASTPAQLAAVNTVAAGGTATFSSLGAGGTAAVVAGGATTGVASSVASQAVGLATGVQEKFSWNAIALAALSGGVGAGLGAGGVGGAGWEGAALRGAVGSVITQGVGDALGLQKGFSWAAVAASAVGAGIGERLQQAGAALETQITAASIANAATRSLIEGSDFGDNMLAALPDMIGAMLGNALVGAWDSVGADEPITVDAIAVEDLPPSKPVPLDPITPLSSLPRVNPRAAGDIWGLGERWVLGSAQGNNLEGSNRAKVSANWWELPSRDALYPRPAVTRLIESGDIGEPITDPLPAPLRRALAAQGVRDGIIDGAQRYAGVFVEGGQSVANLMFGASFDLLYGGNTPELAPSLLREIDRNIQFATNGLPALATAGGVFLLKHPEVLAGPLGLSYAMGSEGVEAGIARANAFIAQDAVDPYGAHRALASDATYGGLTVASIVVAPEALVLKAPSVVTRLSPVRNADILIARFGDTELDLDLSAFGTAAGNLRVTRGYPARAVRSEDGDGFDLILRYRTGWTASQRAAAAAKVQILNDTDTVVTLVQRSSTSASRRYKAAGGIVPAANDVDHVVDLQLGGSDTLSNMLPLNSSVNRSLGSQIGNVIRDMPPGTRIKRVTIEDR